MSSLPSLSNPWSFFLPLLCTASTALLLRAHNLRPPFSSLRTDSGRRPSLRKPLSVAQTPTVLGVRPSSIPSPNFNIDHVKYRSTSSAIDVLLKEQGVRGFFKGWVPTLLGYSAQGACKFGFYEFFKKYYSDIVGPEYATKYKNLICLAGSASAEVITDVALCPMEAVNVRVQTQPGFARGLGDGLPKFVKSEGVQGTGTTLGTLDTIYNVFFKNLGEYEVCKSGENRAEVKHMDNRCEVLLDERRCICRR